MLTKIKTATVFGLEAAIVDVEADVLAGEPGFDVVGLPELCVREARVRVRSAIRHSDLPFPATRVVVNLGSSHVRKEGFHYDLPVALAVLGAAESIPADALAGWLVAGELSLSGQIRAGTGLACMAAAAIDAGLKGIICSPDCAQEALAVATGLRVLSATTLVDLVQAIRAGKLESLAETRIQRTDERPVPDWADVRGYGRARMAMEIAAAGGHSALLIGTPGSGKTMLARRVPGIMPALTESEAIETTKIQSVAGLLPHGSGLATGRPFRAPHHTVSAKALVGGAAGGDKVVPGEVTLAHNGVLFLDELTEFPLHVLEPLRIALKDGGIKITRPPQRTTTLPCNVLLLASATACPCGCEAASIPCACSAVAKERHTKRLDFMPFDLRVTLAKPDAADMLNPQPGGSSADCRGRVEAARAVQAVRFGVGVTNAHASWDDLRKKCPMPKGMSAMPSEKVWRVAATIADLSGSAISLDHVADARRLTDD